MALSSSPDVAPLRLSGNDRSLLLDVALRSIVSGLEGHGPAAVALDELPAALRERAATFVTVTVDGELNGCIGSLEPVHPLAIAVATHAWSAAFADPRLPALRPGELPRMGVKISVLSVLQALAVDSEDELIRVLRPGLDGVLLRRGWRQGTFLPAVWQKLPDPQLFVRHLEAKAGLVPGKWLPGTEVWRYTTTEFGRP